MTTQTGFTFKTTAKAINSKFTPLFNMLILCVSMAAPVNAQQKQNSSAVQSKTDANAQTFAFKGASCSIVGPAGFTRSEQNTQVGKVFVLTDPTKEKKDLVSLTISIVPSKTGNENELLDGVLDPYQKGLSQYKVTKNSPAMINGHRFENRTFSGRFPKGTPTTGFVYATTQRDSFFILMGNANGPGGAQAMPLLLKSIKTFR